MQAPQQPPLLSRILLTPGEARLRAGWRLLGQFTLLVLFFIPFVLLLAVLNQPATPEVSGLRLVLLQGMQLLAMTLSVFVARRLIDRRSIRSLGLALDRRAALDLLVGVLVAGVMMAAIFFIQLAAGWLRVEAFAWQRPDFGAVLGQLFVLLLAFIFVGWSEELFFRGYWLLNLKDGLNLPLAVALSSLVFAVAHLGNPAFNGSAFLGLLLAGIFFSFAFLRSGNLWLPVGLHIGWNFFEGGIFGFMVSGLHTARLVEQTGLGPTYLTGGSFGPEAGLVLIPGLLLGVGLIQLYTARHKALEA